MILVYDGLGLSVAFVIRHVLLLYTRSNLNNQLDEFMKNMRQIRYFIRQSMSYISR